MFQNNIDMISRKIFKIYSAAASTSIGISVCFVLLWQANPVYGRGHSFAQLKCGNFGSCGYLKVFIFFLSSQ